MSANKLRIGFIGLGALGEGLCNNLVKAGYPVVVNDLNKDLAKRLLEGGAAWSDDVAGACRNADVVITVLPSPAVSRAVVEGDWAFVSGTVGVDPATGQWAGSTRDQAWQAIDTIEAALTRAGFELLDVVRVVVHLASRDDVAVVSEVIRTRFGPGRPANTTLCTPLALDVCKVEIEVTAKRRIV